MNTTRRGFTVNINRFSTWFATLKKSKLISGKHCSIYNKLTMHVINVMESPVFQKTWTLTSAKGGTWKTNVQIRKGARQEAGSVCHEKYPLSNQNFSRS